MPTEFIQPDSLHKKTRSLYGWLIATGIQLTVMGIDDDLPWTTCQKLADDGQPEFHHLLLNHSGIEKMGAGFFQH